MGGGGAGGGGDGMGVGGGGGGGGQAGSPASCRSSCVISSRSSCPRSVSRSSSEGSPVGGAGQACSQRARSGAPVRMAQAGNSRVPSTSTIPTSAAVANQIASARPRPPERTGPLSDPRPAFTRTRKRAPPLPRIADPCLPPRRVPRVAAARRRVRSAHRGQRNARAAHPSPPGTAAGRSRRARS